MNRILAVFFVITVAFAGSHNATLTLYKDGYGLVKQPVVFNVLSGRNAIHYSALPDKVETDSPFLSLSKESYEQGSRVIYQRINQDIFDAFTFLKNHVGEKVSVYPRKGSQRKGRLLDIGSGWLSLERFGRVKIFNLAEIQRVEMSGVNQVVSLTPGLTWQVVSDKKGKSQGELIYISSGLRWNASYRMVMAPDEMSAKFISTAVLKNETNLLFDNAQVKLIEGNLKRAQRPPVRPAKTTGQSLMRADAPEAMEIELPSFTQETLGDFHIFTLSEKVTLPRNEAISVTLYPEREVKFSKLYLFENNERSAKKEPLNVQITFGNVSENQLGIPLPAGPFQIFYSKNDGTIEFSGEDLLGQVPVGEKAKVIAGKAFDVLGERTVVNYDRKKKSEEATILLEVKNKRSDPVSVQLTEHIYGDWVIRNPSHDYKKIDAQTIRFEFTLSPKSTETITYTYRKEWQ